MHTPNWSGWNGKFSGGQGHTQGSWSWSGTGQWTQSTSSASIWGLLRMAVMHIKLIRMKLNVFGDPRLQWFSWKSVAMKSEHILWLYGPVAFQKISFEKNRWGNQKIGIIRVVCTTFWLVIWWIFAKRSTNHPDNTYILIPSTDFFHFCLRPTAKLSAEGYGITFWPPSHPPDFIKAGY
jgi:hypothetical protein